MTPQSNFYNSYSLSKKHTEEVAELCCSKNSLPLTILKPSQFYSTDDSYQKHQPFFHTIIDKVANGEDINLYGSNDPLRNYLHIDDFSHIVSLVVRNRLEGNYSCTYPEDTSYKKIINAAINAFSSSSKLNIFTDKADIHDNVCFIDTSLYSKIAFSPKISIEEGMRKIAFHRGVSQS